MQEVVDARPGMITEVIGLAEHGVADFGSSISVGTFEQPLDALGPTFSGASQRRPLCSPPKHRKSDTVNRKRSRSQRFLTILSREPDAEELALGVAEVKASGPAGFGNVIWALVNTREFLFVQ